MKSIGRRTFLRRLGVTLGLPWLESIPLYAGDTSSSHPPKRFVCVFFGNGVDTRNWWARPAQSRIELGKTLQPLAPFVDQLNFVSGLFNEQATRGSIHASQTGNMLSGAPLGKGGTIRSGLSIDQRIAQHYGESTRLPSLVLGCEAPLFGIHKGYSGVYSSHISWASATQPVPLELYPAKVFDALFGQQRSKLEASVLDAVLQQTQSLQQRASQLDRQKLDEYLTSVREVERRIAPIRQAAVEPRVKIQRPAEGVPDDIRAHMRLMADLLVLGLQTDTTRVATLMLNRDLSGMFFPHLGLTRLEHHNLSHNSESDDYELATRFMVSQYAYIIEKMRSIREGDRTLLDSSCVMFCSSIFYGSSHDASEVPIVLGGNLQGTIATGRVLAYKNRVDHERRCCNLYLSLLDRFGIADLKRFGDADQRLAGF